MTRPQADNDQTWTYHFPLPTMDARSADAYVPYQACAWLSGVDGRQVSVLRPFPGFRRICTVPAVTEPPTFFRVVAIPKGKTEYELRGFVVRWGTVAARLVFYYYDSELGTWDTFTMDTTAGIATAAIDVAVNGRYLYYARGGKQPRSIYWDEDDATLVNRPMGWVYSEGEPNTTPAAPSAYRSRVPFYGLLGDGWHAVAYRYYDSDRQTYSPLSEKTWVSRTIALNPGDPVPPPYDPSEPGYSFLFLNIPNNPHFNQIDIFRSAAHTTRDDDAIMFLEKTVDMRGPGDCIYTSGYAELGGDGEYDGYYDYEDPGLGDAALLQVLTIYDPDLDNAESPPKGAAIAAFDTFTAMGDDVAEFPYGLRFSQLALVRKEAFPAEIHDRPSQGRGRVLRIVRAGDTGYAFSTCSIRRLYQSEDQMDAKLATGDWSIVGTEAVAAAEKRIFVVAERGILLIDADTGAIDQLKALERIFQDSDHWAPVSSDVSVAYDAVVPAVFIFNPDEEQAIVIWLGTETMSLLSDLPFRWAATGPDPVRGGAHRAMFITEHGLVLTTDHARENATRTLMGVAGTLNGTATGNGGAGHTDDVLVDTTASFDTTRGLRDCKLYLIRDGALVGCRTIGANDGTSLTLATPFTEDIEAGDIYAISPIAMEVKAWPIGASDGRVEPFLRHTMTQMALSFSALDGEWQYPTNPAAQVAYHLSRMEQDHRIEVFGPIRRKAADNYVAAELSGTILLPGFGIYASNLDYKVVALAVKGKRTSTERDQSEK